MTRPAAHDDTPSNHSSEHSATDQAPHSDAQAFRGRGISTATEIPLTFGSGAADAVKQLHIEEESSDGECADEDPLDDRGEIRNSKQARRNTNNNTTTNNNNYNETQSKSKPKRSKKKRGIKPVGDDPQSKVLFEYYAAVEAVTRENYGIVAHRLSLSLLVNSASVTVSNLVHASESKVAQVLTAVHTIYKHYTTSTQSGNTQPVHAIIYDLFVRAYGAERGTRALREFYTSLALTKGAPKVQHFRRICCISMKDRSASGSAGRDGHEFDDELAYQSHSSARVLLDQYLKALSTLTGGTNDGILPPLEIFLTHRMNASAAACQAFADSIIAQYPTVPPQKFKHLTAHFAASAQDASAQTDLDTALDDLLTLCAHVEKFFISQYENIFSVVADQDSQVIDVPGFVLLMRTVEKINHRALQHQHHNYSHAHQQQQQQVQRVHKPDENIVQLFVRSATRTPHAVMSLPEFARFCAQHEVLQPQTQLRFLQDRVRMKAAREEEADIIALHEMRKHWRRLRLKYIQRLSDAGRYTHAHGVAVRNVDTQFQHSHFVREKQCLFALRVLSEDALTAHEDGMLEAISLPRQLRALAAVAVQYVAE